MSRTLARLAALLALCACANASAQTAEAGSSAQPPEDPAAAPEAPAPETAAPETAAESAVTAADSGADPSSGVEEIVVTAQRREQKLQDVPISVSAVDADDLQTMGVTATEDLAVTSPGLLLQRQQGAVTPFLRGIGSPTVTGGQESPVSLYVDGFYVPQLTAINFSFNNIERIEVLKGPQGTLFGRNATGGLIQIVTRDPSSEPALTLGASYGAFETAEATLYGTTGVATNLNVDLAVFYSDQNEGYGDNVVTGRETGKRKEAGVRTAWLYTPGDNTEFRLSVDYTDTEQTIGVGRQPAPGARSVDGLGPLPDYWDIRSNFEPFYEFEGTGGGLKISHDLGTTQLVSLSAYRTGDSFSHIDQDATSIPLVNAIITDENDTFSQELQLLSDSSGPLSWILGLYYFSFDVDYDLRLSGNSVPPTLGGSLVRSSESETRSYAGYGQGTYALTDSTNLTLGLRFTADERDFEGQTVTASGLVIPGMAPDSQDDDETTWRLALDHRFSPDVMGYVTYNRGFKSGVFNAVNIDQDPVDSETVDAYEIGVKTDWPEHRLRLNLAGFFYDYQDLQIVLIDAGVVNLLNAAEAEIYGAEIELVANPSDRLDVTLGLSWLDTEYTSFPGAQISEPKPAPMGGNFVCFSGQAAATPSCPETVRPRLSAMSASGNELTHAPGFSGNLSWRYAMPTSLGEFAFGGSYVYTSSFYWEPDNRAEENSYGLLNARLEWTRTGERLRVYLFGKNLTEEEYTQFLGGGTLGDLVSAQPPRTFGLGAELRFE